MSARPSIAARVLRWQRAHGRHDLPWQGSRDPYRVWLSEVMLQQTQVATVLGYYPRFLQRFPDLRSLAAAPLDDVLAQWSGLGYYRRARHLHQCAQAVVVEHGGTFPRSAAGLAALPGIGRSTAAAIAAFCFGERAAILDGNVKRVLTRVLGFSDDLGSAANERALWREAESLLPRRNVDVYSQGLMDLGATVCTAARPDCGSCPLQAVCVAFGKGRPLAYPVKTRTLRRGARRSMLLLLQHGQRLWLTQRPGVGVWAGLWSLPETDAEPDWPGRGRKLDMFVHRLTHFDWTLQPMHWRLPARLPAAQRRSIEASLPSGRWLAVDEALSLGLPAPVRRLLETTAGLSR